MKKNTENVRNGLMSEKQFEYLAGIHDTHCISLFIPTSRAGKEVDSGIGQLRLKNSLKELRNKLEQFGLRKKEIDANVNLIEPLLNDVHFWRNQSDGLAVFVYHKKMEHYTLPVSFKEYIYVADHLYLLPVIPFFNDDGTFYLLLLSLQNIQLFECSRHYITGIELSDLIPGRLEDAVGYDYQEKSLQHRSGQGGEAGAIFHGHGAGKDDRDKEIEKFFRAVDDGLMKILHDDRLPLVMGCVDHYYPLYKSVSGYRNIFPEHISGNLDKEDPALLHEKAWLLMDDHFKQHKNKKIEQFRNLSAGAKTTAEINEILPLAVDGRVDTLFIQEGKDKYGLYDHLSGEVTPDDQERCYHPSLYNLAALHTLQTGGQAFILRPAEMPLTDTEINALLKY